ncbi:DUF4405 domain-containing protein [Aliiroseovarius subalbicans]|uniref:DUF4405 domain-containing protein n=1 Tax=Aliiroseovarius subalbicans TaxID=2925840 RepID=UPI001F57B735|nr:DUF4405 domain-containing protein [Aliiroseovarius subalbicans]MCI2398863.1 DUF4405 domain-containing protein [Aliiroseovarius subalbicans]
MSKAASSRAAAVFGAGFSFVVMFFSGLFLVVAPKGSLAKEIDWTLAGLSRDGWEAVHLGTSFLFTLFAVWHVVIHWSVVTNFLTGTAMHPAGHRREGLAMFVIVVFLLVTAILDLPPTAWLVELNEYFKKEYWAL